MQTLRENMQLGGWALAGTTAAAVLTLALLHAGKDKPLTADDVLAQVEQHSQFRQVDVAPVVYERIRVVDSAAPDTSVTMQIWNDRQHGRHREQASSGAATRQLIHAVEATFNANQLPWNEPVSVSVYDRWRSHAGHTVQSVHSEQLESGEAGYRLSAQLLDVPQTVQPSYIEKIDLLVRAADWKVVGERLSMHQHSYEIAELEYHEIPPAQLPEQLFGEGDGSGPLLAEAGANPPQGTDTGAMADLTVEALARLDSIEALAVDQVAVNRTAPQELEISGNLRSEARRAEILRALGPLASQPQIRINLQTGMEGHSAGPLNTPLHTQAVEIPASQAATLPELRNYLQTRRHIAERELDEASARFVADAVQHSSEAQLHAQVLNQIVQAAPAPDAAQLSAEMRGRLRRLLHRHLQASQQETRQLEQQLAQVWPVSESGASAPATANGLRAEAGQLQNLTTDSDRMLWKVFAANASPSDRHALTDARFWKMLKEEDLLATHLAEQVRP